MNSKTIGVFTAVCIMPLRSDGCWLPDERALEALAPRA